MTIFRIFVKLPSIEYVIGSNEGQYWLQKETALRIKAICCSKMNSNVMTDDAEREVNVKRVEYGITPLIFNNIFIPLHSG